MSPRDRSYKSRDQLLAELRQANRAIETFQMRIRELEEEADRHKAELDSLRTTVSDLRARVKNLESQLS
jgi:FtsZ-binding cell division protein ZapB